MKGYLPASDLARLIGCSTNAIRNWNLPFKYADVERFRFSAGYGTNKKRMKVFSVKEAVAYAKRMGRRRAGRFEEGNSVVS